MVKPEIKLIKECINKKGEKIVIYKYDYKTSWENFYVSGIDKNENKQDMFRYLEDAETHFSSFK